MRTILLGICTVIASSALAQRECASSSYLEQLKSADLSFSARMNEIENFVQHQPVFYANANLAKGEKVLNEAGKNVILIPVVVHILYNATSQNISDAQVKSQIDALNRDFRRQNADTINTPSRFKPVAADVQIEFVLATADPKGRATNGIVRRQTNVKYWVMDDKIKYSAQGGDDVWDSQSYLNFWVGNLQNLLGYASIPGGPADKDGVVITNSAFGTINTVAPYDLGRTAVHEVGHWLGLKHVWGDTYCGDDLVDDTPKQGNFTSGCPSGFRSSCDNGPMGDMYMNYMDFTNDACMNLFTAGQKQRMLSYFNEGGPRNKILSSRGLDEAWTKEALVIDVPVINKQFKYYPNPVTNEMILDFSYNENWVGKTISVINMNGIILSKIKINSKIQKLNVAQLKPGIYFLQGENDLQKIYQKFIKL